METVPKKILTIAPCAWTAEAARMLASTVRGAPCFTVDDLRREVDGSPDCKLYRVTDQGATVGYLVLRVERYAGGTEGVIVAAVGKLAGARLYPQMLPTIEGMFQGINSVRVDSCRKAGIAYLARAGYAPTHVTMRKKVNACTQPTPCQQQQGPGGGGSSSSSTSQTTQNIDRRQVVDGNSIGVAADSGTLNVSVLDTGAVQSAIDLVKNSDQLTGKSVSDVLDFAKDVFTQGLTVLDKAGAQVQAQTALVSKAYDNAQGEGAQKNYVAAAALATVAIVAVNVWSKK